uniref:Putative copia LTR rider n=1 Tax=Davidia involucrata TaxID=16924 RepID=A0A5B7BZJ7_DAVIN
MAEVNDSVDVTAADSSGPTSTSSGPVSTSYGHRTSVSNAKFEVEKFDGSGNFCMWQCEVMDVLFQQELDITLDLEGKPDDISEKDWIKMNRQACGTIRLCLAKDQKYFVMRETSARVLWQKLENKFMTKSIENRLYLKKKLFQFQYKKGTSMLKHLDNFNKVLADLQNLDEEIKEEDKALLLLNSLPDSYDHLTTTLLYGKDKIKFDDVSNALVNNEYRKRDQHVHRDTVSEALTVRGRSDEKSQTSQGRGRKGRSQSRGASSEKRRPAKDECFACGKKGHWKKDCPNKKDKGKKESNANIVHSDEEEESAFTVTSSGSYSDEWILDSGCSYHMCPHRDWFATLQEFDGGVVLIGNNNPCGTKGVGKIRLKMHNGSIKVLEEVRYVPDLKKNLISLGVLDSKGYRIIMEGGVLKVVRGAFVAMKGTRKGNLYALDGCTVTGRAVVSHSPDNEETDTSKLWHMRLGHAGEKALQGLVKQGVLKGAKTGKVGFCEHCVLGKQSRVKFGTAVHRTQGILDYVHTDVWGPTKVASLGGKHWFVTFIDDFSRRVWVYTMRHKHEVLDIFLNWKKMIETQTGRKIRRLRSDNGGEYKSDPFFDICRDEGIVRHFTVSGTPQQNGVAERMNRTLVEKVRCMLSNAGLGKAFWAEAVNYACHIVNRLPAAANDGKTPLEVWSGSLPTDYDQLHVFGCPAYFHVTETKLDPRAKKAIFLGFSTGVKGYRLWCPNTKKIVLSRDVTFNEAEMLKQKTAQKENVRPSITQ